MPRSALARLAALAALDDQTLSGLMRVRATLGGTVGAPQLQGNLDVSDGAYANGATGTVLGDMTLAVTADAQQLVDRALRRDRRRQRQAQRRRARSASTRRAASRST